MFPSHLISKAYAVGLALLAFGATYWPSQLGTLAASPGVLIITACVLILPFTRTYRSPIGIRLKLKGILWFAVGSSFLSVALFGWSTVFAYKFFSLALLSIIWVSPLLMFDLLDIEHVKKAIASALLICLFAFISSDLFPGSLPGFMTNFIFGSEYAEVGDMRARGFMEESSHFATFVARFSMIYYVIWESKRPYKGTRLISILSLLAFGLVVLGSKGAVAGIVAAMLATSLGRKQLPYLLVVAPIAGWVAMTQAAALTQDIELFTSTSTRLGMTVTGVVATAVNPLGYGYYGFYGAVQSFGTWTMNWLWGQVPLFFGEMEQIVNDLNAVSLKSTILDFAVVFGWPFIWLMWRVFKNINLRDPRARCVLAYLIITALSTSGHASILFFLGIGVLLKCYPRKMDA